MTAAVVAAGATLAVAAMLATSRKGKKSGRRSIKDLVRPNIASLQPYRCARDDYSEGTLLDANENSIGATVVELPDKRDLNRYPCPYQRDLKEMIAKYRGVRWEQIFIGVGSDEAIDMIMRIFCTPGEDAIMITPPTYGMYSVSAKVNDVAVQKVPLTPEFDVDVDALLAAVTPATKIIFLCSPGNPTAKSIPLSVAEAVLKSSDFDGILVMDEAYVDFSTVPSACCLVDKYPNVVVMQTLSKAFGLAGIRVGMAMGNAEIIHYFNTMKAPYNVSKLASEFAKGAFENIGLMESNVKLLLSERERVRKALEAFPFVKRVCHSDTNFLLFELPKAKEIYKTMADGGVVCRYRGTELHCDDCIRVTIGTPTENETFLKLLEATAKALI
eukprot:CAMPEP_0172597618 /NCGR_PEP_ID=MMETSP1068-20121228/17568_1 /TAXON_ID=35684 /ORGANISM="Pseudopedinella elastica, Strain CCMP716" /LENGTH=385 /DNA_ID=CAMNT_0013397167 /DNA_START=79 /DNA_END=1236 /DNA_ORIENTATION=-